MSASERLAALQARTQTEQRLNYDRVAALSEVEAALPEIVAVVDQFEAFVSILERSRDPWREIKERLQNVAPGLIAALEKKLEGE